MDIVDFVPPLNMNLIIPESSSNNLACGMLVYRVEKSKEDIVLALFLLFILSNEFKTGRLFWITQKVWMPEKVLAF